MVKKFFVIFISLYEAKCLSDVCSFYLSDKRCDWVLEKVNVFAVAVIV